jgi:hypothetical protein
MDNETIETIRDVIEDPYPPTSVPLLLRTAANWFEKFGRDRIFKTLLLHIMRIVLSEAPNEAIRCELEKKDFDSKVACMLSQNAIDSEVESLSKPEKSA